MKKEVISVPIHSVTDLITNSSTTIFTYSEGSESVLTEMINELFNTFGIYKKCEDVFDTVVLCDDDCRYSEYLENNEIPDVTTDVEQLYQDVKTGKTEKPEWFNDVESQEDDWHNYLPSTDLYLIPKDEKYKKLAKLVLSFLYSTGHEATRDG